MGVASGGAQQNEMSQGSSPAADQVQAGSFFNRKLFAKMTIGNCKFLYEIKWKQAL